MLPRPLAGAVASVITTLAFYPLDVRKARAHARPRSTGPSFFSLSPSPTAMYRGVAWDACGSFVSTFAYFHTYESLLQYGTVIAPASAVAVSSAVASPVGTIVRRRQMRDARPILPRTHIQIYAVSVMRNVPRSVIKYSVYEAVRTMCGGPLVLRGLVAGLAASVVSVLLFAPLDYLKTCMSLQMAPDARRLYCGVRAALLHSVLSNAIGHALLEHLSPRGPHPSHLPRREQSRAPREV